MVTSPVNPFSSRMQQRRSAKSFAASTNNSYQESRGAPLELYELRTHLRKALKGEESGHEQAFQQFLEGDIDYGYLNDTTVRDEFFKLISRDLETNAKILFNPESLLHHYLTNTLGHKEESLAMQLFNFYDAASKHEGAEPLALVVDGSLGGYGDLRELLTDTKRGGLSLRAAAFQELRNNDNTAIRFLVSAAKPLRLTDSIAKAKSDLKSATATDDTARLVDNVDEILVREAQELDRILPENGSLAYEVHPTGLGMVKKLEVSKDLADALNAGPGHAFAEDTEFDFGKFFKTAYKLAAKANDPTGTGQEALDDHIAAGLGWLITYFTTSHKIAKTDAERKEITRQFKAVSDTIQGRALLPKRFSKIVKQSANMATFSKAFRDNFLNHNEETITNKALEFFFQEFPNSLPGQLVGIHGLIDPTTGTIEVPNPKTGAPQRHQLAWVDDLDVTGDPQANKELRPGAKISVERAVKAYDDLVERTSSEVFEDIENALPRGTGNSSLRAQALQRIAEKVRNPHNDINDLKITFGQELQQLADDSLIERDFEKLKDKLKAYVESVLPKSVKGKHLWQTKKGNASKMQKLVDELAAAIFTNTDIGSHTNKLLDKVFKIAGKESHFHLIDSKALAKLETLLNSITLDSKSSQDFDSSFDLNDRVLKNIFNSGTRLGRELVKTLANGNPYGLTAAEILSNPEAIEAGELANLLFAQTENGEIDRAKRSSALVYLAQATHARTGIDIQEIIEHLSEATTRKPDAQVSVFKALGAAAVAHTKLEQNLVLAQKRANILDADALFTLRHDVYMKRNHDTRLAVKHFGNQGEFDGDFRSSLINLSDQIDQVSSDESRPRNALESLLADDPVALRVLKRFFKNSYSDLSGQSLITDEHGHLHELQKLIQDLV